MRRGWWGKTLVARSTSDVAAYIRCKTSKYAQLYMWLDTAAVCLCKVCMYLDGSIGVKHDTAVDFDPRCQASVELTRERWRARSPFCSNR